MGLEPSSPRHGRGIFAARRPVRPDRTGQSGWPDSNRRSPAPKTGGLPGFPTSRDPSILRYRGADDDPSESRTLFPAIKRRRPTDRRTSRPDEKGPVVRGRRARSRDPRIRRVGIRAIGDRRAAGTPGNWRVGSATVDSRGGNPGGSWRPRRGSTSRRGGAVSSGPVPLARCLIDAGLSGEVRADPGFFPRADFAADQAVRARTAFRKIRRPSPSRPRPIRVHRGWWSGSTFRSGWGIRPRIRPVGSQTPATAPGEPLGLAG